MTDAAFFDRAEAVRRLGGDETLYAAVCAQFIAQAGNHCDRLAQTLAEGDAAKLRREAHAVKSMLATFSCETGRAVAQQLENLAATGSLDGAAALTDDLIAAMRRLVVELPGA